MAMATEVGEKWDEGGEQHQEEGWMAMPIPIIF